MSFNQKIDPNVRGAFEFLKFLEDKNYVTSTPVEKEKIRDLCKNFEPCKSLNINFYQMLMFMLDLRIIKGKEIKDKNYIHFQPETLHKIFNFHRADKNEIPKILKRKTIKVKSKSVSPSNSVPLQSIQSQNDSQNKNSTQIGTSKPRSRSISIQNSTFAGKSQNKNVVSNSTDATPPNKKSRRGRRGTFVSQNVAVPSPSKKQETKYITKEKCEYCKCSFKNDSEYSTHIKETAHILRQTYRTNKKSLLSDKMDVIQFEIERDGLKLTEIKSDINIKNSITYKITNTNDNTVYEIIDIMLLYTQLEKLKINYKLPILLKSKNSETVSIDFSFQYEGVYMLPIIFKIKNKTKNGDDTYLLKEMVFHIQSDLVNDLEPSSPHEKQKAVTYLEDLQIIDGVPPPKCHTTGLELVRPLGHYRLSKTMIKLINWGLKMNERMTPLEQVALKHLRDLLNVPDRSKCLTPKNYCKMLKTLLEFEEHQMCKNIRDYDCDNQTMRRLPQSGKHHLLALEVPGLAENRPSLIRGDDLMVKTPGGNCYFKGYIHRVNETTVELGFFQRYVTETHFDAQKYTVTFGFNRHTLRTEHQAVELIREHNMSRIFFPSELPKPRPLDDTQYQWYQKLIENNPEQQQAVRHIVSGTSYPYPYLLFGPPGTGKTMTLVEAILQLWFKKPNSRILVAAPSNSAANEVTSRLLKHIQKKDVFRLISQSFAFDKIPEDIKAISNIRAGEYFYPEMEILMKYRVVIVTLSCAAKFIWGGIPSDHFTHVFIDESGHSTESEVLIPIAGIVTSQKKPGQLLGHIVLAGDPKQLGPIIHSKLARTFGFDTSMLERLMNTCEVYQKKNNKFNPNLVTKLLKNFRSHSAILKLPDEMFYDEELIPEGNELTSMAIGWEKLPNPKFPIIFHNVQGKDEQEGNSPSYFNKVEVDIVMKYLKDLIGLKLKGRIIKQSDIGIVSPYRKQVHKLQDACKRKHWSDILIGSVEQFQGQERLIIIVSTVRSKPENVAVDYRFNLGFLRNPKRFNVAITRAKALVIVIGNPNILMWDEHWGKFIEYCSVNKALKGASFEFEQLWKKYDDSNNNELQNLIPGIETGNGTDEHADFSRGNL